MIVFKILTSLEGAEKSIEVSAAHNRDECRSVVRENASSGSAESAIAGIELVLQWMRTCVPCTSMQDYALNDEHGALPVYAIANHDNLDADSAQRPRDIIASTSQGTVIAEH